jgi:hypothetical protein
MSATTTYHVKLDSKIVQALRKQAELERRSIHNLLQLLIESALGSRNAKTQSANSIRGTAGAV